MAGLGVLLVMPHPLMSLGVRVSLDGTSLRVVADYRDARSAAICALALQPDICLLDGDNYSGSPDGGWSATRLILSAAPSSALVLMKDACTPNDLLEALRDGAAGIVTKDIGSASLPRVLLAAADHETIAPRRMVRRIAEELRSESAARERADELTGVLTRRESQVLDLMREGLTTAGIAERLFVSPGTVRSHVMAMTRKLRVDSRAMLVSQVQRPGTRLSS